jgi:hypothetical protein
MNNERSGVGRYVSFHNVEAMLPSSEPLGNRLLFRQSELVFDNVISQDDMKGQLAFRSKPPRYDDLFYAAPSVWPFVPAANSELKLVAHVQRLAEHLRMSI